MEQNTRDILNIKEEAARARAQGMNLSAYTIRRVIQSGQVPCRIVGRTYLISWKRLMDWASCADGCDNPPHICDPASDRL